MHLIGALASGVNGAESGTVAIRARATGGPTLLYSDYQGTAMLYTAELDLDQYGGLEVYVNESVDVTVYDQSHVVVRTFTEMLGDPTVEVVSPAFTGTDYVGGAVGVSKPTTLESVLDRALTSFGTSNWNVMLDSTAVPPTTATVQAAIAMQMQVWNVKNPAYTPPGSLPPGGGVQDDAAIIATCVALCAAAGGGIVWFPPGTYLIESSIAIPDHVHVWGAGANLTTVTIDDAASTAFDFTGCAHTQPTLFWGFSVTAQQANTGAHIVASAVTPLIIRDCVIGNTFSRGSLISLLGTSKVYAATTQFIVGASTTAWAIITVGDTDLVCLLECTFVGPANDYAPAPAMIVADNIRASNIIVALNTTTHATVTTVFSPHDSAANALGGMVTNCTFTMSGTSEHSVVFELGHVSATRTFKEDNNELTGVWASLWTGHNLTTAAPIHLGSRQGQVYRATVAAATGTPIIVPSTTREVIALEVAVLGAPQAWAIEAPVCPRGSHLYLKLSNAGANTATFTLTSAAGPGHGAVAYIPTFAVLTNQMFMAHFVAELSSNGQLEWEEVAGETILHV